MNAICGMEPFYLANATRHNYDYVARCGEECVIGGAIRQSPFSQRICVYAFLSTTSDSGTAW